MVCKKFKFVFNYEFKQIIYLSKTSKFSINTYHADDEYNITNYKFTVKNIKN